MGRATNPYTHVRILPYKGVVWLFVLYFIYMYLALSCVALMTKYRVPQP